MWTSVITAIVVALLQWLSQRRDIKQVERTRIALYAAQLALKAKQWKLDNPVVLGDPLGDFRVRLDPTDRTVSGPDPKSPDARKLDGDE